MRRSAPVGTLLLLGLATACGGALQTTPAPPLELEPQQVRLGRETRTGLPEAAGRAAFDLELPDSGYLVGAIGPEEGCSGAGPVRLEAVIVSETGERWPLAEMAPPPDQAGAWHEWRGEIPPALGGVSATVEIAIDGPGCDVALSPPETVAARGDGRPNVILVSLDTLRADRLGVYGNSRDATPAMDRLAGSGVLFDNAFAPSSWTLPSHFSMLTSLYPSAHGLNPPWGAGAGYARPTLAVGVRSSGREQTLAERLRSAGYLTAAITEDGWVDADFGFDQGFVSYVSDTAAPLERTQRMVLDWLDRHHDLPFFLFLHTYQPHQPYDQPEPYRSMFLEPGHRGFARADAMVPMETINLLQDRTVPALPGDRRAFAALYDGDVRYTDTLIEALMAALDRLQLTDETLVVLTSDHGEELFERGGFYHGDTVYDEVMRVPLIFHWPGRFDTGRRVATPVSLVDLLPTLVELTGGAVGSPVQGRSLVPLLDGNTDGFDERELYGEVVTLQDHLRCVWSGDFKYILGRQGDVEEQLFDLSRDPDETVNVVSHRPEIAARLRREVEDWQQANRELHEQLGSSEEAIDPEVLERLRSLGYVD